MRKALVFLMVLLVATAAWSYEVVWDITGDNPQLVTINLQINCYIQVEWQDTAIEFDEAGWGAADYWSTQLMGLGYSPGADDDNQWAGSPWAGDDWYAGTTGRFFESGDNAHVFVHSNNEFWMDVTVNGDLYGTINSASNTIPTWFTCALCPFIMGGVQLMGNVPIGGNGHYLTDAGGGFFGHGDTYPNQQAFPCATAATWRLNFTPEAEGTIAFLARVERHGMADPGDHYYTDFLVTFGEP